MKPGQEKDILNIAADTFNSAKNSPHLEIFREKGIEVMIMYDRIDEWLMSHLTEYEKKTFQSVAVMGASVIGFCPRCNRESRDREKG